MPRLVIDVVADIAQIRAGLKDLKLDKISIPVELDTAAALKQIEKLKAAAKDAEPDIVSSAELTRAERLDKVMERIATNAERVRPAFEAAGQISERLQRVPSERTPFREQTRAQVIGTVSEVGLEAVGAAATAYTTYKGIRSTTEWLRDNGPKTTRGLQAAFEKLFGSFQKAGRSFGVAASSAQAGDAGAALAGISAAQFQTRAGIGTLRAAGTIAANPRAFATALSSQSVGRLIQKSLTHLVTEAVEDLIVGEIVSDAISQQREASEAASLLRKQFVNIVAPEPKLMNVPQAGVVRPGSVRDVLGSKPIDQRAAMRARAEMRAAAAARGTGGLGGAGLGMIGGGGADNVIDFSEWQKFRDRFQKAATFRQVLGGVAIGGYTDYLTRKGLEQFGVDDDKAALYGHGVGLAAGVGSTAAFMRSNAFQLGPDSPEFHRLKGQKFPGDPTDVNRERFKALRERVREYKRLIDESKLRGDFPGLGIVGDVSAAIPEPKPLISSGTYKANIARMIYGQDGAPGGIIAPAGMFGPRQVLVPPLDFTHAGISSEDIFKGIDSIGKGRMSLRMPSPGVLPMMLNHPMPQAFDVLGEGHNLFRQGGAGMVDFERLFPHAMRAEVEPEWINRIAKLGLGRPYEIAEVDPRSMLSSQEWIKSWLLDQRLTKRDDKYLSKGVGGTAKTRDIASFEGFLPEAVQVEGKIITAEGNHRFVRAMLEAREKILVRVYRPILEVADKLIPMARIDAIANSPEAQRAARVLRETLEQAGHSVKLGIGPSGYRLGGQGARGAIPKWTDMFSRVGGMIGGTSDARYGVAIGSQFSDEAYQSRLRSLIRRQTVPDLLGLYKQQPLFDRPLRNPLPLVGQSVPFRRDQGAIGRVAIGALQTEQEFGIYPRMLTRAESRGGVASAARLVARMDELRSRGFNEHSKAFKELQRLLDEFQPLVYDVTSANKRVLVVIDGHHRVIRAALEGFKTIRARIVTVGGSLLSASSGGATRGIAGGVGSTARGAFDGVGARVASVIGPRIDDASVAALKLLDAIVLKLAASFATARKNAAAFLDTVKAIGTGAFQRIAELFRALGNSRFVTAMVAQFRAAFAAIQRFAVSAALFIRDAWRSTLTFIGGAAGRVATELRSVFVSITESATGQRLIAGLVRVRQAIGEVGIAARGIAVAGGSAALAGLGNIAGRIRVFIEPAVAEARAGAAAIQAAFIESVAGQSILAAFTRAKAAFTAFTLTLRGALIASSIGAAMLQGVAHVADFINKVRVLADSKPFAPFTKAFDEAFAAQKTGTVLQKFFGGLQGAVSKAAELAEPFTRAGAVVIRFGGTLLSVIGILTGWTALIVTSVLQGLELLTRSSRESAAELIHLNKELSLGTDILDRYKKSITSAGLQMTDLKDLHASFANQIYERRQKGEPGVPSSVAAFVPEGLTPEQIADREMDNVLRRIQLLKRAGEQVAAYRLTIEAFGEGMFEKADKLAGALGTLKQAGASPESIVAVRILGDMWDRVTVKFNDFWSVVSRAPFAYFFDKLILKGKELGEVFDTMGDKFVASVGRMLVRGQAVRELMQENADAIERGKPGEIGSSEGGAATSFLPRFGITKPTEEAINARAAKIMQDMQRSRESAAIQPRLTPEQMRADEQLRAETTTYFISPKERLSIAAVADINKVRRNAEQEEIRAAQLRAGVIGTTPEGKEYPFLGRQLTPEQRDAAVARAREKTAGYEEARGRQLDAELKKLEDKPAAATPARAEPKGEDPFRAIERLGGGDAKRALEQTKELGVDRLSALEHMHNLELVSDSTFFARKKEIRDDAFNLESSQLEAEKARRLETVRGLGVTKEQAEDVKTSFEGMPVKAIDAVNAYREAIANLAQHQSRYNKQMIDGWNEQAAAIKALQKSIEDTQHELDTDTLTPGAKSASDVTYQQRLERASIQREFASPELDPAKYELLSKRLGQLNEVQRRAGIRGTITDAGGELGVGRVQEDLQRDEQRLELSRKAGAISNFDFMSQVGDKRKEAAVKLSDAADKMEAAYRQLGKEDPVVESRIKNLRLEVDKLSDSADLLRDSFATALEEGIGGTLEKLTTGQVKSFKDLLSSLGDDLFRSINKRVIDGFTSQLFAEKGPLGGVADALAKVFDPKGGGGASLFGNLFKKDTRVGIDPAEAAATIDLDDAEAGLASLGAQTATGVGADVGLAAASTAAATLGISMTEADVMTAVFASTIEIADASLLVFDTSLTTAIVALDLLAVSAEAAAAAQGASAGTSLATVATVAAVAAHGGRLVGEGGGMSRVIPIGAFNRAPRMHFGGIAQDEVPIIARRGEGIFTAAQMSRLSPVGAGSERSMSVYNQFELHAPADRRTQSQIAHQAGMGVQRALKRNG